MDARRDRFAEEYLVDLCAKQAAIRAGYSPRSAEVTGHRLLRDAKVAQLIQAGITARTERTGITQDVVLGELLRLARVDVIDLFDDAGNLKPLSQIPEDARRAIAGIETSEVRDGEKVTGTVRKVKMHDKKGSLELLGKRLKLFTDKVEFNLTGELAKFLRDLA